MQIYIMRHGEPSVPEFPSKIKATELQGCMEIYKNCGLSATSKPDNAVIEKFGNFAAIVSSDLKRAMESASLISPDAPLIVEPMFREIEDAFLPVPYLSLSPEAWSRVYIFLWYIGAFGLRKSFRQGKIRARSCAQLLVDLAEKYDNVLFVGHGFINTYIGRELRTMGWTGPGIPAKRYWEYGVYQKSISR